MKLELKVTGERAGVEAFGAYSQRMREAEAYTVAEVSAEGDATVVAGHLRAVAESISPKKPVRRRIEGQVRGEGTR